MANGWKSLVQVDLPLAGQRGRLAAVARRRRWGAALLLVGWLHLAAFSFCYYLTIVQDCHEPAAYLAVWVGELLAAGAIFRACGGPRPAELPPAPLELLVRRVWAAYFLLAFDLGSLNTLRGHRLFEFFPAIAPLASFAFLVMAAVVDGRFSAAALVLFVSGLLMAAHLLHAYLIFAVAWWLVLQGIGLALLPRRARGGGTGADGGPPRASPRRAGAALP
jgi:hypothetical protein